jgi:hypothetical protein
MDMWEFWGRRGFQTNPRSKKSTNEKSN